MKTEPCRGTLLSPALTKVVANITPFWVAAVVIVSFLPWNWKVKLGTNPYSTQHSVAPQHRLGHIAIFAITALLFLLRAESTKDDIRAVGLAFSLGCGIEVVQFGIRFAPLFEWWDIRDDAIGAMAALVVFHFLRLLLANGRAKNEQNRGLDLE